MAYETLKSDIQAYVKQNGGGAITGDGLQSILLEMVNTLGTGFKYVGVATPSTSPGTPTENVFYIGGAGTYANFGTTIEVEAYQICVFAYNGSWSKSVINVGSSFDVEDYPAGAAVEFTFYSAETPDGRSIKINKDVSGLSNEPDEAISQWWAAQTERKINELCGFTISIDSLTTTPQSLGLFKIIQTGQIIGSITGTNKLIFGTDGGGSVTVNASDLPYKATANLINVRTESETANNVAISVLGINDVLPAFININEIANHPASYADAATALADVPTMYRRVGVKVTYLDDDTQLWVEMTCQDNSGVNWWTDVENNWVVEGPIETKIVTATGGQQLKIAGEKRGNLDDVLNVNVWNGTTTPYDYPATARAAVPANKRKYGLEITYLLDDVGWVKDQFIGDDLTDWGVADNWQVVGPVSVSQNTETGHDKITIGGVDYETASVEDVSQLQQEVDGLNDTINGVQGGDTTIQYNREDAINYSINSQNLWQDMNKSIIIAITPGKTYKVSGDGTSGTIVGVLASVDGIGYMTPVDFATGYSSRISVSKDDTYIFTAPNNAHYVSMLIYASSGELYPVLKEHTEAQEGLTEIVPALEQTVNELNGQNQTEFNDMTAFAGKVVRLEADVRSRVVFNNEFLNNSGSDLLLKKFCWYAETSACKFYVCIFQPLASTYRILNEFYISNSIAGYNEKDVNLLVPSGCYVGLHGTGVSGETTPMWGLSSASETQGCMHTTFQSIDDVSVGSTVSLSSLSRSTAYGCLFVKGSFMDAVEPYVVKVTATRNADDYNSIREIVNGANASKSIRYEVIVPKGRWFESDLSGKTYVTIIGEDREESIVYCDGDADKPIPSNYAAGDYDGKPDFSYNDSLAETKKIYKHCVYCAAETHIKNLRIEAHNTKYCVHIDSTHCDKAILEDCHIYAIKDGTLAKELNHPIGIGLRGGQYVEIKNCIIESEIVGIGVFAHNFVNSTSGCKLSIQNCYFKNCGYLKTGELGSEQNDIFELLNCTSDLKMVQAEVDATTAEENPQNVPYSIKVNACGTDVVAVQTPVVKGVVSRPDFVRDFMSNFALTMGIGDVPGCAVGKVYTGYMVIKDKYMRVRLASNEPQNPIVGVVFNVTDKFAYLLPKGHIAMIPTSSIGSVQKTGVAYVGTDGYITTDSGASVQSIGAIGVLYTEYNTSDYVYLVLF